MQCKKNLNKPKEKGQASACSHGLVSKPQCDERDNESQLPDARAVKAKEDSAAVEEWRYTSTIQGKDSLLSTSSYLKLDCEIICLYI